MSDRIFFCLQNYFPNTQPYRNLLENFRWGTFTFCLHLMFAFLCLVSSLLWASKSLTSANGFFCLNLIVVQEEKTWEEALEHCRENHDDLTSLLSETENLLAQNQIQDPTVTQRVWVSLRFLGDTWMWVNGDPLEFQAWTQTGDPDQQSPVWRRCGALSKQGEWENRDCQEKLNFICI
uniref:C-type lectin domain-containing protein n=1 Tax=Oryzias latipes TaxID=8090 RepID=A0A3P9MJB7_ORYLA